MNSIEEERERLAEIRSMIDLAGFDIWDVIKRADTTDPYIIMAKHRMNAGYHRRCKTSRKINRKNRRRVSNAESEGGESIFSDDSAGFNDVEVAGTYFPFDVEEDARDVHAHAPTTFNQKMYLDACRTFCVHPVAYFLRALQTNKCILRHRNLTEDDVKAIAVALVGNSSIETLDLSDNDMGPLGAQHIAETLGENGFIKGLNLSNNKLTVNGVECIVDIVTQEDSLQSLGIAGNGLRECDSEVIRPLIQNTSNLLHLDVSGNELREAGGEVIGEALLDNKTLESLDLSWNHLRRDGACFVADGLAENTHLKKLNIAWNGFYMDGCRALSRALELNKTLIELDVTCNRIDRECLEKLLVGLKKNTTLQILRIGKNPITPAGAMMLIQFLKDTPTSGIKELDLTDQFVKPSFVELLTEMKAIRNIKVVFGQVLGHDKKADVDEITLMDENPTIVLMEYGKLMGFRLLDLFAAFDKDGSKSLDHDEIRTGLRMVNIPLSDDCIEILIRKLDIDGDGEIDFGELMAAQAEHRKQVSKFLAAQEKDMDIEETEVGRIRIKLTRLMSKKMSGNPTFKREVEHMKHIIHLQGETKFAEKMSESLSQRLRGALTHHTVTVPQVRSPSVIQITVSDKLKQWKHMI